MDSSILWLFWAVLAQVMEVHMWTCILYPLSNTYADTDGCSANCKERNSRPASHARCSFPVKKKVFQPIVSRYIFLYKYVGYGNLLNAEEKEKEEKARDTDHGENPTAFHGAVSTGQNTKKPPLA